MTIDYNNHNILTKFKYPSTTSIINAILFTLDFIIISITINNSTHDFLEELKRHLKHNKPTKEKHCKNPIYQDLFKFRNYFDLNNIQIWVLTGKEKPLKSIDVLIRVPHPDPGDLIEIEKVLNSIQGIKAYWLSKIEPTFDFITNKPNQRDALQTLLKQTMHLRHGREAFSKGDEEQTDYINFRTSVKQARVYQKEEDAFDELYESLRFEMPIKKRKLFTLELIKPTDILKYDMRLLDEVGFYGLDDIKLKRSLLDYHTDHFFSHLVSSLVRKHGFHLTQLRVRKWKECPRCEYYLKDSCALKGLESGTEKMRVIQKCKHTKLLINFRTRYCREIQELSDLKRNMITAFNQWKTI